ncbi:MAG: hypothetical protein K2K89_06770 [Ruminococcus sp.]|nr:hypothetical protein [Ruminococcus sp.]
MNLYIDSERNGGYPYIEDLPEMPSLSLKKPYYDYLYIIDSEKNNGYPAFTEFNEIPSLTMKKIYPHGYMICMKDINNGYPCISELNNISVEKFSLLYFGGKHIGEIYCNGNFISYAYYNEKEVFSIKYVSS